MLNGQVPIKGKGVKQSGNRKRCTCSLHFRSNPLGCFSDSRSAAKPLLRSRSSTPFCFFTVTLSFRRSAWTVLFPISDAILLFPISEIRAFLCVFLPQVLLAALPVSLLSGSIRFGYFSWSYRILSSSCMTSLVADDGQGGMNACWLGLGLAIVDPHSFLGFCVFWCSDFFFLWDRRR